MMMTHTHPIPKPEDAGDDWKQEYEEHRELETLNSMIPIWKRKKGDTSDEEYNEFYKNNFYDYTDPMKVITAGGEGAVNYNAVLFIPSHAPYDFYTKEYKKGLALYSSGVMIMENAKSCFRTTTISSAVSWIPPTSVLTSAASCSNRITN